MPEWVLYEVYAEEHPSVLPQNVPEVVTVESWQRWLIWKKAQSAREVHEAFKQPGALQSFTPEQKRLLSWPMGGEY